MHYQTLVQALTHSAPAEATLIACCQGKRRYLPTDVEDTLTYADLRLLARLRVRTRPFLDPEAPYGYLESDPWHIVFGPVRAGAPVYFSRAGWQHAYERDLLAACVEVVACPGALIARWPRGGECTFAGVPTSCLRALAHFSTAPALIAIPTQPLGAPPAVWRARGSDEER